MKSGQMVFVCMSVCLYVYVFVCVCICEGMFDYFKGELEQLFF